MQGHSVTNPDDPSLSLHGLRARQLRFVFPPQKLREYTEAEHLEKKGKPLDTADWTDYSNPKTPQQSNGYDCGVFSSQFIESLSRKGGQFDFTQKNMVYLRHKMVAEIKQGEFIPEEYL